MTELEVYIDGGCTPNPGKMRIAIVIPSEDISRVLPLDEGTNNRAEYLAFIYAMEMVIGRKITHVPTVFYTDSQLLYGQVVKGWKVKKNKDLYDEAMTLFDPSYMRLEQIPRNKNEAGWLLE